MCCVCILIFSWLKILRVEFFWGVFSEVSNLVARGGLLWILCPQTLISRRACPPRHVSPTGDKNKSQIQNSFKFSKPPPRLGNLPSDYYLGLLGIKVISQAISKYKDSHYNQNAICIRKNSFAKLETLRLLHSVLHSDCYLNFHCQILPAPNRTCHKWKGKYFSLLSKYCRVFNLY